MVFCDVQGNQEQCRPIDDPDRPLPGHQSSRSVPPTEFTFLCFKFRACYTASTRGEMCDSKTGMPL